MKWNHKTEVAGLLFILFFPAIAGMVVAILFPFMFYFPVLFCILLGVLFTFCLFLILRRVSKEDKKE